MGNAAPPPGYYDSANGLSGMALKDALYNIIKGHTVFPYSSSSSTDVSDCLKVVDEDPLDTTKVRLHYKNTSVLKSSFGTSWNREHVWPQSLGADVSPKASDLHHIFAEDPSINSSRGNSVFNNVTSPTNQDVYGNRWTGTQFEVRLDQKGDVARALFYMAVRYPDFTLINSAAPAYKQMGVLNTLLSWNTLDPVDAREQLRNDRIYELYQHNRNPFVDHPEWVNLIFGSVTNSNTVTVDANPLIPGGVIGAGSLNTPLLSLELTATANEWDLDRLTVQNIGSVPDAKITSVRLYRDMNNSSTVDAGDALLASGTFSAGSVTLVCNSPSRVTTTPARFLISANLAADTLNGQSLAVRVNTDSIDCNVSGGTDINPTTNVNLDSNSFTVSGGVSNGDQLQVNWTNRAASTVQAGAVNFPVLSLNLQALSNEWDLASIAVTQSGTIAGTDVAALKLYLDANNNGVVDAGETLLQSQTLSGSTATFNLTSPQRIGTTPQNLLIAADVSPTALNGSTLRLQVTAISYSATGGTDINPTLSGILSNAATVTGGVTNGDTVVVSTINRAPASVVAGLTDVPLLTVRLTASGNEWDLGGIAFTKLGTLADSMIPGIKLYQDENQNGEVDQSDTLLANTPLVSGAVSFTFSAGYVRVGTTPTDILVAADISGAAPNNTTIGVRLQANSVTYQASGGVDINPNNVQADSNLVVIQGLASGAAPIKIAALSPRGFDGTALQEYVVLANQSHDPVNISGWEFRTYAGGETAGSIHTMTIATGVIPPMSHFLIASSEYNGVVTIDASTTRSADCTIAGTGLVGTAGVSDTNGRAFAIFNGTGATASRIDAISYGGGPTNDYGLFEGTAFSGTLTNAQTQVYARKRVSNPGNYIDTDNNSADLQIVTKFAWNTLDVNVPVTLSGFIVE